jgi:plasmid stabilization system protein ParE
MSAKTIRRGVACRHPPIDRAMALANTPYQGREVDEPNVRVIVVPRFRYFIFYTIDGDEIHITHFRHTSRRRPWDVE